MAHRYRMYPTAEQAAFMLERHCADARYVWNLAVEQFNWGQKGRPAPGPAQRQKQLAEARQANEWLAAGSSPVQQQALRDFDRAAAGFFNGVYRRPTWRRKHLDEGFCIRDTRVETVNRKWAQVFVPKLGLVKFRLSRPLPAGKLGMARVTCKAGRWHVAFPGPQPEISGAPGRDDSSGMLQDAEGGPVTAVGDTFVVHMDRESLNDFPQLGKYDVTVEITEFEPDRLIAWTILGQIRPQIGHVYGYRLEPTEDGAATLVTSFYDWSNIDQQWRDAGIFPVISQGALRATLGILDRTVRGRAGPG